MYLLIAYALIALSVIYSIIKLFDKESLINKAIKWLFLFFVIVIAHQFIILESGQQLLQNYINCNDKDGSLLQDDLKTDVWNLK